MTIDRANSRRRPRRLSCWGYWINATSKTVFGYRSPALHDRTEAALPDASIDLPDRQLQSEPDVRPSDREQPGLGRNPPFVSRPGSGHDTRAMPMCDQPVCQNGPFQLERLRTVLYPDGSSPSDAVYVGFGIARTALSALRMSSLIRFYERTGHRNEPDPKRASRSRGSRGSLSAEFPKFLSDCSTQTADKNASQRGVFSSQCPAR